jgi:hypothetical protein
MVRVRNAGHELAQRIRELEQFDRMLMSLGAAELITLARVQAADPSWTPAIEPPPDRSMDSESTDSTDADGQEDADRPLPPNIVCQCPDGLSHHLSDDDEDADDDYDYDQDEDMSLADYEEPSDDAHDAGETQVAHVDDSDDGPGQ